MGIKSSRQATRLSGCTLKNKKILITAGPTWVPIDNVRVISNISTGRTGILLSERLSGLGADVTLLLGPAQACCLDKKIRLLRFRFFDELKKMLMAQLKLKKYAALIHCAAVSDYQSLKSFTRKESSNKQFWRIDLKPTEKIIDAIKKIDPSLCLVGFKYEPQAGKKLLIENAANLMHRASADLVVANSIIGKKYLAYIIKGNRNYGPLSSKEKMVRQLTHLLAQVL